MTNGLKNATSDFAKSNGAVVVSDTEGPSLTRQEFLEECDINKLMARYDAHVIGGPGNLPPQVPIYADFCEMPTNLFDYMQYMNTAEATFMTLPAVVRKTFDNSAMQFVEFASDPANLDQMRSWGLAPPAEAPRAGGEGDPSPVVTPPPAAS